MDKRIESIAFKRVVDENPDLSWLGEYDDRAALNAIDRKERGDMGRDQMRYFIPTRPENANLDYAHDAEPYKAVAGILRDAGIIETPDHVAYNDSGLDIAALDESIKEIDS